MDERFPGRLTLADGEQAEVEIALDEDTVRLSIEGRDVGTWPIRFCKVSRDEDAFTLSLDGEVVAFEPVDLHDFSIAAAQRFRFAGLADRINVIRGIPGSVAVEPRELRDPDDEEHPSRWRYLPLAVVLVGAAVAAVMLFAGGDGRVTEGTAPRRSVPVAGAVSPFEVGPRELVAAWNQVSADLGAPTVIDDEVPHGPFEVEVATGIVLQGRIDGSGTIDAVVLSAASDAPQDLVMAVLDVAIATAVPGLDAEGRRDVLAELGIDADRPRLTGLQAEVEAHGVRFSITHLGGVDTVLFTFAQA